MTIQNLQIFFIVCVVAIVMFGVFLVHTNAGYPKQNKQTRPTWRPREVLDAILKHPTLIERTPENIAIAVQSRIVVVVTNVRGYRFEGRVYTGDHYTSVWAGQKQYGQSDATAEQFAQRIAQRIECWLNEIPADAIIGTQLFTANTADMITRTKETK